MGESQQINIQAVVLPARSIILDQQGHISQIVSNTADNVTPNVYRGSVAAGREAALTAQLLTQYNSLLAQVARPGPGVLYRQSEPPATLTAVTLARQPSLLAILGLHPSS